MPNQEQDLVDVGSRFSTQRLIEQGAVAVAQARAHASELAKWFPAARVDELDKNVKRLRELFDEQAEKKFAKATGNVPVAAAAAEGKRLVSDIIAVADNAFDMQPEIADQFHQGGKIGRSVPRLVGRIETLLTVAAKYEKEMAAWGFGKDEAAKGKKTLSDLQAANTAQEKAVKDLPPKTRELCSLKGRTFLVLKQLSRASRRVFVHDPATAAKFGVDILNRRAHRPNAAGVPDAGAGDK